MPRQVRPSANAPIVNGAGSPQDRGEKTLHAAVCRSCACALHAHVLLEARVETMGKSRSASGVLWHAQELGDRLCICLSFYVSLQLPLEDEQPLLQATLGDLCR